MSETLSLPVDLTEAERMVRARELAAVMEEHRAKRTDLDRLTEAFKGSRKTLESEIEEAIQAAQRLGDAVSTGREKREVEIRRDHDDERFTVTTVRVDTGEIVRVREMTGEERRESEARRQRLLFEGVDPRPSGEATA